VIETDCPICGARLRVPVIDLPGAGPGRTADLGWLRAHFRTHGPRGGEPQALAA
jgi:hypothetical protein